MSKQHEIEMFYELDAHNDSPCVLCGGPVPEHQSNLYFSLMDEAGNIAGNVCEQCTMQHAPEKVKERDDIFTQGDKPDNGMPF